MIQGGLPTEEKMPPNDGNNDDGFGGFGGEDKEVKRAVVGLSLRVAPGLLKPGDANDKCNNQPLKGRKSVVVVVVVVVPSCVFGWELKILNGVPTEAAD